MGHTLEMGDIDFPAAKAGDVCNHLGDIRGFATSGEAVVISKGEVAVTAQQAEDAARFGWSVVRDQLGLVLIWRKQPLP